MLTARVLRVLPAQETNIFPVARYSRSTWAAKNRMCGPYFIDERIFFLERAACSCVRMCLLDAGSFTWHVSARCPVEKFVIHMMRFALCQICMIGMRLYVPSSYMSCMVHFLYLVGFKGNHVSERFARARIHQRYDSASFHSVNHRIGHRKNYFTVTSARSVSQRPQRYHW